jgi:hypothetical protein
VNSAIAGSRRISLAGTCVALAILVSACGGKNKSEAGAPDELHNAEAAPVEEAPPDAGVDPSAPIGVPSCDGYVNTVQRYAACPKVDPQTRASLQQGIDAMKQAWSQMATITDPAVLKQVDDACKQAIDTLRQSAVSLGCPI